MGAIMAGTPVWVWPLLAYTVWAGIRASQPRATSPASIAILPGVLLAVSARQFMGGATVEANLPYLLLGLAAGVAGGWLLGSRSYVRRQGHLLHIAGSWLVLAASLLFFGVQYWLGYLRATNPASLNTWPLGALSSLASTLGTGLLVGRAGALLWHFGRAEPSHVPLTPADPMQS